MSQKNPHGRPVLPPTYVLAALAAAIVLHSLLPIADAVPFPWSLGGILPLAFGIWITLAADRVFKKHGTTVKPFQESTVLITDGPYRISRHPMYLGMILIVLGFSSFLESVSPFIVVPALWILFEWRFVRIEEQMMSLTFGPEWQRYTQRVRRWI